MAKIQIQPDWYLPAISAAAGADHSKAYVVKDELYCPDVSQAALDAALAGYNHDSVLDVVKDEEAEAMLASPVIQSLIEEFVVKTGIPDTVEQVRTGAKARLKLKL
jgi:hypothetical protein